MRGWFCSSKSCPNRLVNRFSRMFPRRLAALCLGALTVSATSASAHGFGQRYDLPLPLGLWVLGAGATVVLTFAIMALYLRDWHKGGGMPSTNLLRFAAVRWLAHPVVIRTIRTVAVAAFVLTLYAGWFGDQDPNANIITILVWVVWWVGFAFVCALVGNLWALVNPIRTLFVWAEAAFSELTGGRSLSRNLPYPSWLKTWPGVVQLAGFAWAELVWGGNGVPGSLANAMLSYSVVNWAGMFVWGREIWLRNGDAFSIAFGILSRFAPLDAPATSDRFEGRALILRPPGAGLMADHAVTFSFLVFVLLLLSTVTFDGYLETPLYRGIAIALYTSPAMSPMFERALDAGFPVNQVIITAQMILLAAAFVAVFWAASWAMVRLAARQPGATAGVTVHQAATAFVLTLLPIAVAYHLSHYLSFFLTNGQYIIPLISDPLGRGWDLFGTASYRVDIGLVAPGMVWYSALTLIVVGHAIAVFLAHGAALRVFVSREAAMASQIPMVVLMVMYTMLSLWIVAQPIVG